MTLQRFVEQAVRTAFAVDQGKPWMKYAGMIDTGDPALFVFRRDHPVGPLLFAGNVGEASRDVPAGILPASMDDIPLDFGGRLAEHGAFVGSHAVVILSDRDDIRAEEPAADP
mgnify:CR=1 FL=1